MDDLSALSLRQLRCFLAVARTRSVAEAARELGLTQPAASRRIQEMESRLGLRLFERVGRRMEPTAAAAPLRRAAEAALTTLGQGVRAARGGAPETVRIGAMPTVSGGLVPRVAADLAAGRPDLTVRIETGMGEALLDRLRAGRLDLVVGRMGRAESLRSLAFEPLYRDRLGAFARPGHALAGRTAGAAELATAPLILPPPDAVVRPTVDAFLAARGLGARPAFETAEPSVAAALLRGGDAVWIISAGAGEGLVQAGALAAIELDAEDTIGDVGIARRADDRPGLAVLAALTALRAGARG